VQRAAETALVAFGPVGASRRFLTRLGLITAGAAAWRIWYVLGPVMTRIPHLGLDDEFFYSAQARLVADGKGFLNPFGYFAPVGSAAHRIFPTAVHPPLYTVFLAVPAKLGLSTPQEQRIFTALLGCATVFLIGMLGRRIAGERTGLIAALLAAAYPALWSNDSMLGLETLYGFLVILALLAVYRMWSRPNLASAALVAVWLSLATLTRSEGVILFAIVALPAIVLVPGVVRKDRVKMLGVMSLVAVVLVGPWVVRNLTTFEKPTLLGSGFGWVLLDGSCDTTFYGSKLGYWDDSCSLKDYPPTLEETLVDERARTKALDYIGNHKARLPVVVLARIGRVWDLYRPTQNVEFNIAGERRGHAASWAILVGYYLLLPGAIAGLVVMRKRRVPIFPFLAIAAATTLTVALSFGITRYRAPVDVVLPVLAAVAIDAALRRRHGPRPTVTEDPPPEREPVLTAPTGEPMAR
jgi:4-amino-4-deoxy-L-arabinose transferase-like glycosyltransferase